jgi:hypothetical protein
MAVINFLVIAENLRMLFLFVMMVAGYVSLIWQLDKKMNALGIALRGEMDERFTTFHKTLKENDFAHLNETIKALTFTLQKNKILEPEDKRFVDSHLEGG